MNGLGDATLAWFVDRPSVPLSHTGSRFQTLEGTFEHAELKLWATQPTRSSTRPKNRCRPDL